MNDKLTIYDPQLLFNILSYIPQQVHQIVIIANELELYVEYFSEGTIIVFPWMYDVFTSVEEKEVQRHFNEMWQLDGYIVVLGPPGEIIMHNDFVSRFIEYALDDKSFSSRQVYREEVQHAPWLLNYFDRGYLLLFVSNERVKTKINFQFDYIIYDYLSDRFNLDQDFIEFLENKFELEDELRITEFHTMLNNTFDLDSLRWELDNPLQHMGHRVIPEDEDA